MHAPGTNSHAATCFGLVPGPQPQCEGMALRADRLHLPDEVLRTGHCLHTQEKHLMHTPDARLSAPRLVAVAVVVPGVLKKRLVQDHVLQQMVLRDHLPECLALPLRVTGKLVVMGQINIQAMFQRFQLGRRKKLAAHCHGGIHRHQASHGPVEQPRLQQNWHTAVCTARAITHSTSCEHLRSV